MTEQDTVRARARLACCRSQALRSRTVDLLAESHHGLAKCLLVYTTAVDMQWSAEREVDLVRLSRLVGRDPAIERAKTQLMKQFGVSRTDAFTLLTEMSQQSNQKVRVIAQRLVSSEPYGSGR